MHGLGMGLGSGYLFCTGLVCVLLDIPPFFFLLACLWVLLYSRHGAVAVGIRKHVEERRWMLCSMHVFAWNNA